MAAAVLVVVMPVPATAANTPNITITDVTVTEGTGGTVNANFTIQASPPPSRCCPLQVNWSTAPGSANAPGDFTASSGTVTLSKFQGSRVVNVSIVGDSFDESNETFVVNLTTLVGAPGQISDAQGVGTIIDNDAPPTISVNDVSVTEGNAGTTTATFTVSPSAASGNSVTFDWSTAAGTATAGTDYVSTPGSSTIAAGATSTTIVITVNGDVVDEADETFTVTLSNPVSATIADGTGLGTITDDDAAPTLSIGDVSLAEGNAGTTTATFTVTLSAASGQAVPVDWATVDGTATQLSDYISGSGTLTFPAGTTTRTIGVTVNGETVPELDETFRVTLSNATNAVIGDAVGVGTILDDEFEAVIDIDDPTGIENDTGTTTLAFSVTLSNPSVSTVTVEWSTTAGTATSGLDYFDSSGIVTFAPQDTSETVLITVNGDGTYEPDETLALDLSNATGAPIGDSQGIGTIVNDDDAPVAFVANVSVAEGNSGTSLLTFVVSLSGNSDVDASFDFATADATATAGADYLAASGTLTILAGASTGTVGVVVDGDVAYESNETLSLTLSNPTGATIGDGVAQGTITNDDKAPTSLTLRVVRKPHAVVAKGILEPATSGEHVTVTLFRKQGGRFVKVAAKTVSIRYLKDRDGDGKTDGSYTATFTRPKTKGSYKLLTRFKGTANYKPRSLSKIFTLAAS